MFLEKTWFHFIPVTCSWFNHNLTLSIYWYICNLNTVTVLPGSVKPSDSNTNLDLPHSVTRSYGTSPIIDFLLTRNYPKLLAMCENILVPNS